MAHEGSLSMTFAKGLSSSIYSNECSIATAWSKSFLASPAAVTANWTTPKSPVGGPHQITSPFFKAIDSISCRDGSSLFELQEIIIAMQKSGGSLFITAGFNLLNSTINGKG